MFCKVLLFVSSLMVSIDLYYCKTEIPSYLHICKRSDPDVGNCIKQSIESLKTKLAEGIPELQVPPLEPLYIKELTAIEGRGLNVAAKDIHVKGCSNFVIQSVKADVENGIFECDLSYDKLDIDGKYVVNGSILMMPIKGDGELHTQVMNAGAVVVLKSKFIDENGEKHLKWDDVTLDIHIGKGKVQLTNLFGGEKLLGDTVNAAINMNFNNFFKELKPMIEKVLAEFFLETAQKITQGYDYNAIFPN